jgi:SWI/SNF-related matrix-associated actin-dependent regulator of chromatin subfamily A-like protein 1
MNTVKPLYPYQVRGIAHLKASKMPMLGDEPGLGKTVQAMRAAEELGAKRVLVLAPAIGRVSWQQQYREWNPGFDLKVYSYDTVAMALKPALRSAIRNTNFDVAILDEAHFLKNPTANRTKAVYGAKTNNRGVVGHIPHVMRLSGTFAPNHYGELWTHLHASGMVNDTYQQFIDDYCQQVDTGFGPKIVGSKNADRLRAILDGVYLGRRKVDVMADMPPLSFVTEPLAFIETNAKNTFTALDSLEQARNYYMDQGLIAPGLDLADGLLAYGANDPSVSTARRELGLAKVPAVVEWLKAVNPHKSVLFAHHREVIQRLEQALLADRFPAVSIHGQTPHKDRVKAVEEFQTNPDVRVFVGQITAAGTAITLTAANEVAIVEPSWTPGENYQAACRVHRIGVRDGVVCRFLCVPGTLDEAIARASRRKAEDIAELFD